MGYQSWIADKFKSFIRLYKDFDIILQNHTPLLVFLYDDALHILQKNTCIVHTVRTNLSKDFSLMSPHMLNQFACNNGRGRGARQRYNNKKCGIQMSATQNRHWGTLGSTLRVVFGSPCVAVVPAEEMRCRMRINHACVGVYYVTLFLDFVIHNTYVWYLQSLYLGIYLV